MKVWRWDPNPLKVRLLASTQRRPGSGPPLLQSSSLLQYLQYSYFALHWSFDSSSSFNVNHKPGKSEYEDPGPQTHKTQHKGRISLCACTYIHACKATETPRQRLPRSQEKADWFKGCCICKLFCVPACAVMTQVLANNRRLCPTAKEDFGSYGSIR